MLHKKRTGKAFHITKDIVEKEAMYEEVDERYQEKRIKMLQAQNMQIEEEFHQHLLKAFAKRASMSNASSIASRRASTMTPVTSVDNSRKMSLDLSNLRSNSYQPQGQMISPMPNDYALSPSASYDPSTSYMCMNGSESPYTNISAATPAQIPAPSYIQTPSWSYPNQQNPNQWTMQIPTPDQTPTESQAVQMWQQQMMQQAPETVQMHHFRDRLASAPELLHQTPPQSHSHSRVQSQPSSSFHNLHLLTQPTQLPKVETLSAETHSTPDFCPTPHTPISPMAAPKVEADAMVSGDLDPDFTDFSQFALHLGNSVSDQQLGFDDFVAVDEFTSVSC